MKNLFFLLFFFSLPLSTAIAQGVRGKVLDAAGEPLPYASIYITELNGGASTNMQGEYEVKLYPGTYTLRVQYLGYQALQKQVQISGSEWVEQDFRLEEQVEVLRTVEIKSKGEDPAYTIMRKAIAKRKYHRLQYDSYSVKVYMKGTGKITDAPFFLKKKLEEDGLLLDEAYTSESISQISFEQPNKLSEKVISIRSSGQSSGASPSPYIMQSFYNEKVSEAISPLSGAAFAYYRFFFEGSYQEGDLEINKIRVTPRSRGEQVFEGYLYIIDDLWAIHSLDLKTVVQGFQVQVKQNYAEVAPKLWMPLTHQISFSGEMLGFAGEYRYLASCSNYQVELNQDLISETEIIDEKVEVVPQEVKIKLPSDKEEVPEILASQEKLTKKQFRKLINQYEKESLKAQKEPEVVSERNYAVDSLATKYDSAYWASIRPVPLTEAEIKGYQRDDSLAQVEQAKLTGVDSTGAIKKSRLDIGGLLFGKTYNFSPRTHLELAPILFNVFYNTVEGLNVNLKGSLLHQYDSLRQRVEFQPHLRYGFASEDFYAKGKLAYTYRPKGADQPGNFRSVWLEGGKFVSQFNEADPIHPHINTFYSLLFNQNYLKLYEKMYGELGFRYQPSAAFSLSSSIEWAQRQELFDQTSYSWYGGESRQFSSNRPQNQELATTAFPEHQALLLELNLSYRPGLTYRIRNGKKIALLEKAPELLLRYRKGVNGLLGSDVDFDQLQLGVKHGYEFGVSGRLEFELQAGTFLNSRSMYFMDYQHFDGNRTILTSLKPAGSFRLLDYYRYSTNESYAAGHTHYQFRKFLLTQLPMLRFTGLRENIFFNYLKTETSPHYYELGYSIDNILRMFRVELAASFEDGQFKEIAPRIGISTSISIQRK